MIPAEKTTDNPRASILENLKDLPTFSTVVAQLMMTINQPTSSARDLERLIANDEAIAARILKLANSAFYGLPGKVTSLARAITLLGFNTVRSLVLTIGVIDKFSGSSGGKHFDRGLFWEHSLSVAMASRLLCAKDPSVSPEEAHISGLLHDIGKIIMDNFMPEQFRQAMDWIRVNGGDALATERKFVGISHDRVGALAAEKWRFPGFIRETIACHHKPFDAVQFPDMVQLVALANEIVPAFKKQEIEGADYRLPNLTDALAARWLPSARHEEVFVTKYEVEIEKVGDILKLYC